MKIKRFFLLGLLTLLAVLLAGCASGLNASAWPAMLADTNNAYVAGGQYVYAINLQTGAQVWRFPEKASANPFDATPAIAPDGQLIVGGYDKKLYSLNLQTGQSNWQFTGAKDRWIGGPIVVNDMIYAPNADYNLYALNLQGQLQWTFLADQSIWGSPATDGNNIYFGTLGKQVYAVDAKTGKQVWMQKVDGAVLGSPVVGSNATLYIGTYAGMIYAMDTANGTTRWTTTASSWIWSGPVIDDTNIYYGDGNGDFYGYPLSGNSQPWKQTLNGAIIGSPLVNGNTLVVATEGGNVYYADKTGMKVQPVSIAGKIYSTPIAAGELTLVAPLGGNATVVALDSSGAIKWSFTPPK